MKHIFSLIAFAAGACALVGRPRHENDAVANNAPNLQARHRGWRTRHWHDDDDDDSVSTCTITVTVTVTQPAGDFPSSDGPFFNTTVPANNSTTPTSIDDQAPITLIDISTLLPASDATSDSVVPAPTASDDLAPSTSADVNTEAPLSTQSSSDNADASAPVANSLAPDTLIILPTAANANANAKAKPRAPRATGKH